jgi:hypothetical protein
MNSTLRLAGYCARVCAFLALVLTLALVTSCREGGRSHVHQDHDHEHDHAPIAETHAHAHAPPHGGTAVVLGAEEFHLEFLLDQTNGVLRAYVLDGHLENFVRLTAPAVDLVMQLPAGEQALSLAAVANSATGETVGDTSLFSGKSDALKGLDRFSAVLPEIEIRNRRYTNVGFRFPEGNH